MAAAARTADSGAVDRPVVVVWEPQPGPQTALIACPVPDVLFGGARGGGKTDGVLGDWLSHADKYGSSAIGLMIRRERTQLIETIERSRQIYSLLGAKFHEQDKMWRFSNGARLRFAYCERDADAEAYQGHSYSRVYVEEVTNFPTSAPIDKLQATLRSAAGVPVGFRATGNPGGPGHNWVRARYIDPAPGGWQILVDERTGLERVFIPSRLTDNRFLGDDYVRRLRGVGSDALVKAWLDGDWSAIEGAFFAEWSSARHVVEPFAIPATWLRFRSMDWGSAAPFSVGWWAVIEEPVAGLPRGAIVRYREWYGKGEKLTAEEVARGIVERSGKDKIDYTVLDPAAFAQDGGPSIAERMAREGVLCRKADNRRLARLGAMGGWDQMRARLRGDAEGRPMIACFSTCADSIRTIPVLQHDPDRPEDLDTEAEDHAADDWRYASMSRPFLRPEKIEQPPKHVLIGHSDGTIRSTLSVAELIKRNAKLLRERA